ncbi:hypothetical protein, partial [Nocardiopsis lambiniae]
MEQKVSCTPLFSTYRQGGNRVTSSMLAVFERIGLSLVEEILAKASDEATLETVCFLPVSMASVFGSDPISVKPPHRVTPAVRMSIRVTTSPYARSCPICV